MLGDWRRAGAAARGVWDPTAHGEARPSSVGRLIKLSVYTRGWGALAVAVQAPTGMGAAPMSHVDTPLGSHPTHAHIVLTDRPYSTRQCVGGPGKPSSKCRVLVHSGWPAMPRMGTALLLLAGWMVAAAAGAPSAAGGPRSFTIEDDKLLLDGKPMQVISGR